MQGQSAIERGPDLGLTWRCLYDMPFEERCAAVWVGKFSSADMHLQAVVFVGDLSYADDFVSSPPISSEVLEAQIMHASHNSGFSTMAQKHWLNRSMC